MNRCLHVLDFSLSGFLNLELMLARSRCLYQLPNTEKGFLGMLNYTLQSLGVALLGSQWPTRPPFSRSASPFRQLLLHSRSCSRSCSCVLNPEALVILRACRFFGSAAPSFPNNSWSMQSKHAWTRKTRLHTSTATDGQLRLSRKTKKTYRCLKRDKRKLTFEEVAKSGTSSFSCTGISRFRCEEAACCAVVL